MARSEATAQVLAGPGDSPAKSKARAAASKPSRPAVVDPWSFEEAYCVKPKPKPAEAPPRAAEPAAAPESPLAVFEMVRETGWRADRLAMP